MVGARVEATWVVTAKPKVPELEAAGFEDFPFPGSSAYLKWEMVTKNHFAHERHSASWIKTLQKGSGEDSPELCTWRRLLLWPRPPWLRRVHRLPEGGLLLSS